MALLREIFELRSLADDFLALHRNCPVEIRISGLPVSDLPDGCGVLYGLKLLVEPNGRSELEVGLRDRDSGHTVMIPAIRSCDANYRLLKFNCDNGVRRNLECQAAHSVCAREKLLLFRHLAVTPTG